MATTKLRKSKFGALPWIGPAILMIFVMVLWPAIEMIRTSFQNVNSTGKVVGWSGITNYKDLMHNPDLPSIMVRTLLWVVIVTFFTIIISLPVARN